MKDWPVYILTHQCLSRAGSDDQRRYNRYPYYKKALRVLLNVSTASTPPYSSFRHNEPLCAFTALWGHYSFLAKVLQGVKFPAVMFEFHAGIFTTCVVSNLTAYDFIYRQPHGKSALLVSFQITALKVSPLLEGPSMHLFLAIKKICFGA